jgi:hypothetical protein
MKQGDGVSNWSHFSPQMSSHEDLNEAKQAMKKAQKKVDDTEARFTEEWTTLNGSKLTAKYDKDMKSALNKLYENLQSARKLYNDLVNQTPAQGIV